MSTRWGTKGDKLQVSIASVYTDIPGIKNLRGPGCKPQIFDATALDSGVPFEKQITGHTDGGTVSATIFFDPANAVHKHLLTIATTPATSAFKRIFPDTGATTWPFSGIITQCPDPSSDVNAGVMANFEITVTGLPTFP